MATRAIIYGDIVGQEGRDKLERDYAELAFALTWKNDQSLFKLGGSAPVVFVDLDIPDYAASDFLLSVATAGKNIKLIGKSNHPDLKQAMRVSKLGVSEILTSDQCLERLGKLLAELEPSTPPQSATPKTSKFGVDAIVGSSPQMAEIRKTVSLLSDVDFPSALILGETGTGKSLLCKVLHHSGVRSSHNMVEVNCSAIPDELFESELFGHTRGAFTDAKQEKTGLFEYAQKGTLFLDEVGNLSASAQAKLLKILEDKKLRKVGDVTERDIDVRVVAATNLDLHEAIAKGKFREDLYFRLNLLTLEIPPLRERLEDIRPIIEHYVQFYATLYGKPHVRLTEGATAGMLTHHWPGNVRELCNVIERAVLLSRSRTIGEKDIEAALSRSRIGLADRRQIVIDIPPQGTSLSEIEQQVVKQTLDLCDWNKTEAAKFLGISRPRLRRILENAGLEQNRRSRG